MGPISQFIDHHFRHFNAASLRDAAVAYKSHVQAGRPMMVTLAGAMSSAELGLSFAEMIRQDKVQAITCTGANLEEDIYNLVAHDFYERIPNYRDLTPQQEKELLERKLNRVTDTCIPEEEAMRRLETYLIARWDKASTAGESYFPHQYMYQSLLSGELEKYYQIDPENSWLLAAAKKNLPLFVPGWEDSTNGNMFAARVIEGEVKRECMKSGIDYMIELVNVYKRLGAKDGIGFFQIGGGIAGDFPICVVPLLEQDMKTKVPKWSYFCQISDSTTSYGSYSGAVPNEKITWGKLGIETPKFIVESDASICAPLIFGYVLGQ
jgi:deoxyhypusine synthase